MRKKSGSAAAEKQDTLQNAIQLYVKENEINEDQLCEKICNALVVAAKKEFGVKDGIFCEIDKNTYEIKIHVNKLVVEEVFDEDTEISVEDAQTYKEGAVPDDVVSIPLSPDRLGRVAAQTVKHTVRQGIREIGHEKIYNEFQEYKNLVVSAVVTNVDAETGDATVSIGKTELRLPKKEQIPGEVLEKGKTVQIFIVDVKSTEKGPKILISRINTGLVKRLFEKEVSEISDGTVEIRSVAREPGARTKIAVYSKDENVDPIGACIGPKGVRVNKVIEQLGGEKIDIVKYSENPREYVSAALSPADVVLVEVLDEQMRNCRVTVPEDQLSLAIGNKGQNAKLAAKLTGWKIDIKPSYGDNQPMIQL